MEVIRIRTDRGLGVVGSRVDLPVVAAGSFDQQLGVLLGNLSCLPWAWEYTQQPSRGAHPTEGSTSAFRP